MNIISAASAIVHTTQSQTVTQSTEVRDPRVPLARIVDEPGVAFGDRHNYEMPIIGNQTAGQHINWTV